jgi:hypothetical protein
MYDVIKHCVRVNQSTFRRLEVRVPRHRITCIYKPMRSQCRTERGTPDNATIPDPLSSPLLGNTVTTPLRGLLLERSTRSKLNAAQECRGGSCMCVVDKADILYEFPYSTQVRRLMPAAKPSTHLNGWKAKSGRRSGERNGLHLVAVLGHVPFTEAPIILWQHCAGAAAHRMGCTLAHRV